MNQKLWLPVDVTQFASAVLLTLICSDARKIERLSRRRKL